MFVFIILINSRVLPDESKKVNLVKMIHIKDLLPSDVKIQGVCTFNNNFYLLLLIKNKFEIFQTAEDGKIEKIFKRGLLDSLSSPTSFFVFKDKIEIVDYNPDIQKCIYLVMNKSLNKISSKLIPKATYTNVRKSENSNFYYYFYVENNEIIYIVTNMEKNQSQIIAKKKLKPSPRRGINFYFEPAYEKIITCFDDEYKITVHNLNNNKTISFLHPNFKNKPYTEQELQVLPTMLSQLSRKYEPFPKVIQNILFFDENILIIIRKQRPTQSFLTLDKFDIMGVYKKTIKLDITQEDFLEIFRVNDDAGILTASKDKYIIRIVKLK